MDGSMFDGLGKAFGCLVAAVCVCAPFAIWKGIELVVWLYHHVHIQWH